MKISHISSAELPQVDTLVKQCVNSGQWLLFKSRGMAQRGFLGTYYLTAGDNIFSLDGQGELRESIAREGTNLSIDELFYFNDIPAPKSLSNATKTRGDDQRHTIAA